MNIKENDPDIERGGLHGGGGGGGVTSISKWLGRATLLNEMGPKSRFTTEK